MKYSIGDVMRLVDHSGLKPYLTENDISRLIEEAHEMGNYAVCIEPIYGQFARSYLDDKKYGIKLDITLDFPFGSLSTSSRELIIGDSEYADEVDVVVPLGYVKSHRWDYVDADLRAIVGAARDHGLVIKIITEDGYLTREEKQKVYRMVIGADPDFIKTSTGFAERDYCTSLGNATGATPENVEMMSDVARELGSEIGIKAAGGIHTYQEVERIIDAAKRPLKPEKLRLGMSGTRKLFEEMKAKQVV
ncbi:deoxyribose-phosphate aldolase [Thermoplasma sp.]|uniref:deoxyribose-phosphate aldolase n=1 Tax=Thermoplasma sp. TaxID=1973142 RepID=UPI00126E9E21|nr:deoxyribose-phosphate aldolase [Thermoplasma sp.]KAA8922014.1 MAG: deoxyribose-phosphate aldolase [Thermoplasma sp.]